MTDAGACIGLVPARGGSKAIPRKNLAPLRGKPLLAYTGAASVEAGCLDRVLLSTDDEEIAEVGRACGAEVPFLRPSGLSTDSAPMLPVMIHALDWCVEQGLDVEAMVLLQPTSPLRTGRHIREAVALLRETGAQTVVSVVKVPHQFTPGSIMKMEGAVLNPYLAGPLVLRRQDKDDLYARNGPAILAVREATLRRGKLYGDPTVGYVMSEAVSLDIDTADDLWLVETYLERAREHAS